MNNVLKRTTLIVRDAERSLEFEVRGADGYSVEVNQRLAA